MEDLKILHFYFLLHSRVEDEGTVNRTLPPRGTDMKVSTLAMLICSGSVLSGRTKQAKPVSATMSAVCHEMRVSRLVDYFGSCAEVKHFGRRWLSSDSSCHRTSVLA